MSDYDIDYEADDRQAKREGRAFSQRFGLSENKGRALAYKRMGYSATGLATRLDVANTTAKSYMNDLAERFGDAALWAYHANESDDPLSGRDGPESHTRRAADQPEHDAMSDTDATTDPLGHIDRAVEGDV